MSTTLALLLIAQASLPRDSTARVERLAEANEEAYLEAQGIFGRLQMDLMGASAPLESLQQRLPLVESLAGKLREAVRGPTPNERS